MKCRLVSSSEDMQIANRHLKLFFAHEQKVHMLGYKMYASLFRFPYRLFKQS